MSIIVDGDHIKTDEQGFLVNPDDWNEKVMEELIRQHEAAGHKKVDPAGRAMVLFFRDFYEDHMRHPTMNEIVRAREKLDHKRFREAADLKEILYDMFPHGPVPMLAKLAGLPQNAVAQEMED